MFDMVALSPLNDLLMFICRTVNFSDFHKIIGAYGHPVF